MKQQPNVQALADIIDNPLQSRDAFLAVKPDEFVGERDLVTFFEKAHDVFDDFAGDALNYGVSLAVLVGLYLVFILVVAVVRPSWVPALPSEASTRSPMNTKRARERGAGGAGAGGAADVAAFSFRVVSLAVLGRAPEPSPSVEGAVVALLLPDILGTSRTAREVRTPVGAQHRAARRGACDPRRAASSRLQGPSCAMEHRGDRSAHTRGNSPRPSKRSSHALVSFSCALELRRRDARKGKSTFSRS